MITTTRDLDILRSIAHYYTLTRAQISRLHFPTDAQGRMTRKRLDALCERGVITKTKMQVSNPMQGLPAPVYFPTALGIEFLVEHTGDESWKTCSTQSPNWTHLYHYTAIADHHILIDAAAKAKQLCVQQWYGEYSILNPHENDAHKRYTLFSLLNENPRLVCKPDAGFLLEVGGYRKVFYLETDRDTTKSAERVAAQKSKGYEGLFAQRRFQTHFPTTNVPSFTVLVIVPSVTRRNALQKAFTKEPMPNLYKFAARPELTPENFFTGSMWLSCDGRVSGLIKEGQA
jgi:Replication-relaxation